MKRFGSVELFAWVPWSDESTRKATPLSRDVAFAEPQTTAPYMKASDRAKRLRLLVYGLVMVMLIISDAARGDDAVDLPAGRSLTWGDEPVEAVSPTRGRIVLNGLWRFRPAGEADAVPRGGTWGWAPVPGAWYASGFKVPTVQSDGRVGTGDGWPGGDNLKSVRRAWYERPVTVPAAWDGREVLLRVDRPASGATVYLDDRRIGALPWPGGEVTLTDHVTPGREQTLRILVDAAGGEQVQEKLIDAETVERKKVEAPTRGLIGDVTLTSRPTGPHIDGVFVQPSVREKRLVVEVDLAGFDGGGPIDLAAEVRDDTGRVALRFDSSENLPHGAGPSADARRTVRLAADWPDPRLWDLDQPNLYTLHLTATDAGARLDDAFTQRFGFREFWVDGRDFYLNGTKLRFRPVAVQNFEKHLGSARPIIDAVIRGWRRDNFNLQEVWPDDEQDPGNPNMRDLWATAADEAGMLMIMALPSQSEAMKKWDQPGVAEAWEAATRDAWREMRNHPAVVGWGLSANRFGFYDDQNPLRLGHRERGLNPTGWYRDRLAIAKDATDFVKNLDPTRVILHHAGAVAGDIYSANTYLNLLPLQEREEWLSAWAKDGDMPVMAVEFGLPLFFTGLRGRAKYTVAKHTEPLFTEFAAMYLGPAAYKLETEGYRRHIAEWHLGDGKYRDWWFEHSLDPAWIELQRLFIERTWRSWRTFGVSGGMVPWAYTGPFDHWWKGPKQTVEFTPGQRGYHFAEVPAPLLEGKTGEWQRVEPRIEALRAANQPTLAYLGGDPGDSFTAKDHHFYGGETVTKSVVLINDSRIKQPYRVTCTLKIEGGEQQARSDSGELEVGEVAVLPVSFELPPTDERRGASLTLQGHVGSTPHHDGLALTLFPRARSGAASAVPPVLIYDPEGETTAMLERLGVRIEAWDGQDEEDGRVLVIGRRALSQGELPGSLDAFARDGGRVVVMGQEPDVLRRAGFRVARYVGRRAFVVQEDHPTLAGLDADDLRDWNGAGTLVPATDGVALGPNEDKPPFGWHWGNGGSVSSAMIEKPHLAGWTPILEGEWDLAYSPLMELRRGRGLALLCTLDLEARTETDPVADRLMLAMLRYAVEVKPWEPAAVELVPGDSDALDLLQPESAGAGEGLPLRRLFVLDGGRDGAADDDATPRGDGDTVLHLRAGPGSPRAPAYDGAAPPDWPVAAGLSRSDLRPRVDLAVPRVRPEPGLDVAAEGVLARRGGTEFHLQLDPRTLDVDEQPYLRYTRWRFTRVLSQVLANLGVELAADDLDRFNHAAANSDTTAPPLYHPDYISPEEDFEMSDDPYRYYRW